MRIHCPGYGAGAGEAEIILGSRKREQISAPAPWLRSLVVLAIKEMKNAAATWAEQSRT